MILSFADKDTEKLAGSQRVGKFRNFERVALRKLTQLDIATTLEDLQIPPGNRLELLSGNRKGQYAIRINDQFRICFVWTKNGPQDVEITDYH
jgi:proteic killer suppression protein